MEEKSTVPATLEHPCDRISLWQEAGERQSCQSPNSCPAALHDDLSRKVRYCDLYY